MIFRHSIIALTTITLIVVGQTFAQNSNGINITPKLALNAYLETYYAYDFGQPENNRRPSTLYNFTDHNSIDINTGIIGLNYRGNKFRTSISFVGGTYANENMATEPKFFKNIYEANFGIKLSKKHDLWFDFGIMESNAGFESARSSECYTLSRSLLAESSPYYLNAAKLGYKTKNKKWEMELIFSNGWQQMVNGFPSIGHTLIYKPNDYWKINSSSFLGRVKLEGAVPILTREEFRIFHNFYAKYEKEKYGFILGIDYGVDQLVENREDLGSWVGAAAVFRYKFNKKWASAVRTEYFLDPSNSVTGINNISGFENFGASLNVDYQCINSILIRAEGRMFTGKEEYYSINDLPSRSNFYLGIAVSFRIWKN
ncbi:outer membrane beta-barrel protein [Brumimicrobium mesophilum]|uniref:outer membrane beta-barrel protein n=1 Tax=Brumimicrobium mesophilum TaxID=392717 RepID=UPI000D13F29A|nr:outer membrane beta-barrel protein [Brumimicrobium mesophilum]